jgi:hypothetical protein
MSSGPRPRQPLKVVVLVVAFWTVGNVLQAVCGWAMRTSGLLDGTALAWGSLVVAWGLLFVLALAFHESLDRWLRS